MSDNSMFERLKLWNAATLGQKDCLVQASWTFQGVSSIDQFDQVPCPPSPYAFHLTLTGGGLGCCYSEDPAPLIEPAWVGQDARRIEPANRYQEVSLLDSVFGNFHLRPAHRFGIAGSPQDKSQLRAEIIAGQVELCAKRKGLVAPRIVMVGVVGKAMKAMHNRGMHVQGVDMNPEIIGQEIGGGVRVFGPEETASLIAESDIALITGMAVVNDTLGPLVRDCERAGSMVVVYGQTGANFAPFYLENGISCVVSESFPLYTIPGCSEIRVFIKD